MHPPKIFISATSGDLRSVRQIVKEALLTINCHPVEQTNFEPDARTVENMLRGKISDCQALIHICGMRYGAEPDVATLPPGTPRRSYTQWEYHIARQLQEQRGDDHFRVYTFICPEDFPYDEEPDTEPQEKRDLQLAHRTRLFNDPHLRESPAHLGDIQQRILALQENVLAIRIEEGGTKKIAKAILAALGVLAAITLGGFWLQSKKADLPPPPPNRGAISVVVVMGENVEYEIIMRDAFLSRLEKELAKRGYTLKKEIENPEFVRGTYASPHKAEGATKWAALMRKIHLKYDGKQIDYFVTLGSHATTAVKEAGLKESFDSKLIYLGVTDPVKAEFVGNFDTAGVQYGTGGLDYGAMVDSLFKPDQELVFLYNKGVPQDEYFADDLGNLNRGFQKAGKYPDKSRFSFDMKLEEEPINISHIQIPDVDKPASSPVYFAWYGLDNILGDNGSLDVIKQNHLWVVPSTYSTVNLKTAGVIVSVDDKLVGEMGADIVLKKIDDKQLDLRQEPISRPPFRTWICRKTIAENFLERTIRPEILNAANRKDYPWITFDDAK